MLPIERFKIEDKSMEPTLRHGDYVLVNKLAYVFGKPAKGDMIVLKHPKEKNKLLIKRISAVRNSDEYFVVGDNKNYSKDSRHFGSIDKDLIIGKVFVHVKRSR